MVSLTAPTVSSSYFELPPRFSLLSSFGCVSHFALIAVFGSLSLRLFFFRPSMHCCCCLGCFGCALTVLLSFQVGSGFIPPRNFAMPRRFFLLVSSLLISPFLLPFVVFVAFCSPLIRPLFFSRLSDSGISPAHLSRLEVLCPLPSVLFSGSVFSVIASSVAFLLLSLLVALVF